MWAEHLRELLDGVGLGVDGYDGDDEEDGEADDLVRVAVAVGVGVRDGVVVRRADK